VTLGFWCAGHIGILRLALTHSPNDQQEAAMPSLDKALPQTAGVGWPQSFVILVIQLAALLFPSWGIVFYLNGSSEWWWVAR
jgi:hypothetical protein